MIFNHSKPGEGVVELVFDGKNGWLVCRTLTYVALIRDIHIVVLKINTDTEFYIRDIKE